MLYVYVLPDVVLFNHSYLLSVLLCFYYRAGLSPFIMEYLI